MGRKPGGRGKGEGSYENLVAKWAGRRDLVTSTFGRYANRIMKKRKVHDYTEANFWCDFRPDDE